MSTGTLTVDLNALTANWQVLAAMSRAETGAVVKADAYGLGAARVGRALARAGARTFFVAVAEEGAALRQALGPGPTIYILSGHMAGDADMLGDMDLTPILNSLDQMIRHLEALPAHPFGLQLDTGMNRLGMEPSEWSAVREVAVAQDPQLIISHLAAAEDTGDEMNRRQLALFREMTEGVDCPLSLANTGGVLLNKAYHFDVTRPGIGLYGGRPFADARPVVSLDIPVIQCRDVAPGEVVGYNGTWMAQRPSRIATISAGYADGLLRALSGRASVWADEVRCPLAGRVSMDLIGVDITDAAGDPKTVSLLGPDQTVDDLADAAGTIGYEILTSLGARYNRRYLGG
ncbi:alanine racemase [Roseovarius nanhaiticus]|uniref:Alanine racemase n=1 Tax=Roseovarius nanhaiticus TaxID=573024 RepID=A0A1N7GEV7_9RHOB|nr:alanine racemase [Roseovarius nanhaiticus]SEK28194.1 alanine racemase [Roseovarius nanhaiticus]SIS11101.1 alanine racemase [Roseovarius nanhaiticus]